MPPGGVIWQAGRAQPGLITPVPWFDSTACQFS